MPSPGAYNVSALNIRHATSPREKAQRCSIAILRARLLSAQDHHTVSIARHVTSLGARMPAARLGDTCTEITAHGFRAIGRTIQCEELEQKPEVIDQRLAHAVPEISTAHTTARTSSRSGSRRRRNRRAMSTH